MRLIDADALTEKCGDWYVEEGTEEGFIGTLGQLLSVQPETNCSEISNNWIPCSERLPEDNTRVQVTFANGEVGQSSWHKENEYNNGFDAVMHGVTDRHFVTFGVIAWMPLPEPYQEGE